MSEERNTVVRHWLRRAEEAIGEAEIMAQAGHWNACVNRLYYACFYAVTAWLRQRSLSALKHSGVRALFNREMVKPGFISRELATLYNDLFENRQEADYVDLVRFEESQVRPWIAQARQFVQHVQQLLTPPAGEMPNA